MVKQRPSHNTHMVGGDRIHTFGDNTNDQSSVLPGSGSLAIRDLDDVRDAIHGGFESPKLDPAEDHGSLRSASFATVTLILLTVASFALIGWLSNRPMNRTPVSEEVLTNVTCRYSADGFRFSAQLDPSVASTVGVLDDAAGLEVRVTLVDVTVPLADTSIASKTAWMDFALSLIHI